MTGWSSVDVQEAGEGEQAPSGEPAQVSLSPSARRKGDVLSFLSTSGQILNLIKEGFLQGGGA